MQKQKLSRYVIKQDGGRLEFRTRHRAHLLSCVSFTALAAALCLAELRIWRSHAPVPVIIIIALLAIVIIALASTQVRLLTRGETFVFDRETRLVTRYGGRRCAFDEISSVRLRRLDFRLSTLHMELVRGRRRSAIVIDAQVGSPHARIGDFRILDAQQAAGKVASFLGVPLVEGQRER